MAGVGNTSSLNDFIISEDEEHHNHQCGFYIWKVTNRKSLLTDNEVRNNLVGSKTKSKHKNDFDEDEIQKINTSLSSGVIRRYLDQEREIYNSFKSIMINRCVCPQARVAREVTEDVACCSKDLGENFIKNSIEFADTDNQRHSKAELETFKNVGLDLSEDSDSDVDVVSDLT